MFKIYFLIILIFIDFISKKVIFNYIDLYDFIELASFLELTHIHNYGIAFGLFSGQYSPYIFVVIGIIVSLFIIFLYFKSVNTMEKWALLLIISGAIANILDRSLNSYVLDFIYLHYKDFYWPAFNFADIYISIGIFIIILQLLNDLIKKVIK